LPDEHGLTLLRSLRSDTGPVADCIILTAARDLRGVRTAMHLGAVYYLVKPFGFAQLREQLEAYRRWREQIACSRQADQATVDILYQFRRMPHTPAAIAGLPPTVRRILSVVSSAATAVSAADIAQRLGMSQAAAHRCLTDLQKRALTELELEYGATGRPIHRYRLPRRRAGGIR